MILILKKSHSFFYEWLFLFWRALLIFFQSKYQLVDNMAISLFTFVKIEKKNELHFKVFSLNCNILKIMNIEKLNIDIIQIKDYWLKSSDKDFLTMNNLYDT